MRSDQDRLIDILTAIEKINSRVTGTLEGFEADDMLQVWTIHYLQVIGEAARGVSPSVKDRFPDVPWSNCCIKKYSGAWVLRTQHATDLDDDAKRPPPATKTDRYDLLQTRECFAA